MIGGIPKSGEALFQKIIIGENKVTIHMLPMARHAPTHMQLYT